LFKFFIFYKIFLVLDGKHTYPNERQNETETDFWLWTNAGLANGC